MKRFLMVATIMLMALVSFAINKPAEAAGAYFDLSPSSGAYYIGQPFFVNVMINTASIETDAADIVLYYDPTYLEIIDSLPAIPGTQIEPGAIYQMYPGNEVDTATGRIRLTAFSMLTTYNSGSGEGLLAKIHFRGKQVTAGTPVSFEYTPGDSHDCNIAETMTSRDILSSVTGGIYQIIPDTTSPYITNLSPAAGVIGVNPNTNISFHIKDDQTAVDINSIVVVIDGVTYTATGVNRFTYSGSEKDYLITIDPPTFNYDSVVTVHIEGSDIWSNSVSLDTTFTTGSPPVNQAPIFPTIPDKYVYAGETLIFPVQATDPNSGDSLTITMTGAPAGATLTLLSNGQALFNWPTTLGDLGDYSVIFKVTDGGQPALSLSQTVIIHVIERIIPPPVPPSSCPACPPCGQRTACSDNRDNDGDGLTDYPADPACRDNYDNDEYVLGGSDSIVQQVFAGVQSSWQRSELRQYIRQNLLNMAASDASGFLSLSPSSGNFYPGQTFNVNILVGTDNADTDAVDVVLTYDPTYLEVIDALPGVAGVQIAPGTLYEAYPGNIVDTTTGEIKVTAFSVMSTFNSGFGSGVFATINFRAKQIVTGTLVTFDFTDGVTTDSNIALHITSEDILKDVNNGSYNIVPDARPPYVTNFSPTDGAINRSPSTNITFHVKDDETSVDINSLKVRVEDVEYTAGGANRFSYSGTSKDYSVTVDPPNFDYEQVVDVYIEVQDTQGNAMTKYSKFTIMPLPVNKPPVLELISDKIAYTGTNLSFTVRATDPDSADILTYSLVDGPTGATLVKLTNNQAFFDWSVPTSASGEYYITIRVEDNGAVRLSDEQVVKISINKVEVAPAPTGQCQPCSVCPQCLDGFDNDGDGAIDYPNDPGCESADDTDETNPAKAPLCSDGIDNDNDGLIDYPNDPGCESMADDDEIDPIILSACSDKLDNDGDGFVDYPADPGCISASDDDETDVLPPEIIPTCSDGLDNDGDGLIDYPADPDCLQPTDQEVAKPQEEIKEAIVAVTDKVTEFIQGALEDFVQGAIKGFGGAASGLYNYLSGAKANAMVRDYITPVLVGLGLLNLLWLLLFIMRQLGKIRGVIYDSQTKERINLAVVRVFRCEDDALMTEVMANAKGVFSVSLPVGEYFIKVYKQKYLFPSLSLFGLKEDAPYKNLYFGEVIKIEDKHQKIYISLPLDPSEELVDADRRELKTAFLRKLIYFVAVSALLLAIAAVLVLPKWWFVALLVLHLFLYLLIRYLIKVNKHEY